MKKLFFVVVTFILIALGGFLFMYSSSRNPINKQTKDVEIDYSESTLPGVVVEDRGPIQ